MVANLIKEGNTMKKFLISALITLSASLAHAETDPRLDITEDCDQHIGLAVSTSDRIASHDDASTYTPAGGHLVTPIDCAITPYVGYCETVEASAPAY